MTSILAAVTGRRTLIRALPGLLAAVALTAAPAGLSAQSAEWTAALMVDPYPTPFVAEWERNPQTATLTLSYTGSESRDFRIEAWVQGGRGEVVGRVVSPPYSFAFGPVSRFFNVADVLGWSAVESNSRYVDLALRTGVLPEDDFRVCVRVVDLDERPLTETCERITIALPDPPQLLLPEDGAVIASVQPVFQWTPITVPPEIGVRYRVRVVERSPQQTPRAALEANIPHLEREVSAPLLAYPLDGLPLEEGKEYVWRVEVVDAAGQPLTRGGRRGEIRVFRYQGVETPPIIAGGEVPDTLTLIPGLARLAGLTSAEVDETPFGYVVNGWLELLLDAPYGARLRVEARDLEIQKGTFAAPVIRAGRIYGRLARRDLGSALPDGLEPVDIAYAPGEGLTVAAALALTGGEGEPVRLDGRAQLTAAGLSGRLAAEAADGEALATVGDDPVRLRLRRAQVVLPGGGVRVTGALDLFDTDVGCAEWSGRLAGDGTLSLDIACSPRRTVPLVPGTDYAHLTLATVTGAVDADVSAPGGALDYSLVSTARLSLGAGQDACGGVLTLSLADGEVTTDGFRPNCGALASDTTNLDWLAFQWSGLRLEHLAYIRDQGFEFEMFVDAQPLARDLAGLELPPLPEVRLTEAGMEVPAVDEAVRGAPVRVGGFGVEVTRVSTTAIRVPWSDWRDGTADRFRFELELALTLPELPPGSPGCLATERFPADRAVLTNGRIRAEIAERVYDPACALPIAGGSKLLVERFGGVLDVRFAPAAELLSRPTVAGALELPPVFACEEGPAGLRLQVGDDGLGIGPRGGLVGRLEGVAPDCPLDWAAAEVRLADAVLEFGVDDAGTQAAVLDGAAEARFAAAGQPVQGSGRLAVDLVSGEIVAGRVDFQGPFGFELPAQDPVFRFRVQRARLDTAGLRIDGRNALLLPGGDSIRTTFANLVLDPGDLGVTSGSVRFDTPFALEVGIDDQTGELTWRAVAQNAALGVATGMRVDLPPAVVVGPDGVTVDGEGSARLLYGGRDVTNLVASFSDDFALGLDPVRVRIGRLTLSKDGVQAGYIDPTGFYPALEYLANALVPGRLGLPTEDVAYLELRQGGADDGALLVNTDTTGAGTRIYTAQGQPVSLVRT